MSPELSAHLDAVESIINKAKEILGRQGYPTDLRTVLVGAFIGQTVEHHEAMLLLIRNGKAGSAFALARGVVENMYRGLWVNFCATPEELERFEKKDEWKGTIADAAAAIDDKYQADGFFLDLKKRGWKALNGYAHTGMLQLGRRYTGQNLQPNYSDGEIIQITTTVTTCALLLIAKFLAVQNHPDQAKEVEAFVGAHKK